MRHVDIITPRSAEHMAEVRQLFVEYADFLGLDLSFQGFDEELANLPGTYAPPHGALLLARVDGQPAGCCALRPMKHADHANAAEMKRLFVLTSFRGLGLGRKLGEEIIKAAIRMNYSQMLLDTLHEMQAARLLYADLGFEEIPPYYHNPLAGAHYLKLNLSRF